jgi:hypothetical protein
MVIISVQLFELRFNNLGRLDNRKDISLKKIGNWVCAYSCAPDEDTRSLERKYRLMLARRRTVIILGSLVVALILYIGINVLLAARNAAAFPKYWQDQTAQPIPADAIRLVALG